MKERVIFLNGRALKTVSDPAIDQARPGGTCGPCVMNGSPEGCSAGRELVQMAGGTSCTQKPYWILKDVDVPAEETVVAPEKTITFQDVTTTLAKHGVMKQMRQPRSDTFMGKASNPKDAIGDTKVPLALTSPIAEAHWSAAQFAGMTKYGAWNWRVAGVRASVYISAMKRHIAAYVSGEERDPTDGTHHLGNVMACAAILLDAREAGKLTDDRPPRLDLRDAYEDIQALMVKLKKQYADKNPHHYTITDTELA